MSAAVAALIVTAVAVDFGTSIYAEYQLSRAVRRAADLGSDPFVAILDFPFIPQVRRDRYNEVEIKAHAADQPMIGKALLEATMHSVDLTDASWRFRPGAKIPVARLESRIIIDTVHLGRYLGVRDLMVEAPPNETNDATGGTTESGISDPHGLVFTGTPTAAGFDKRVSVTVDLSMADPTTLVFTPTGILTGPDTANQNVPDDQRAAVLAAFAGRLPQQHLPFGIAPTSHGARGSDVIIEGIADDMTVTLPEFRQS
ncbi:mannan chain length control protein LmeA [Mycobacterium sp. M1]|uniref:Mannan chain length control protein LmeA n=1 Tax=Mycolicibacter acidiphilus TaxID=2835306 RepID=A0ABS5RDT3_9MYCO|nr:mannan chain length control protein LmeA [Mycolicibacter acidiphilus]MBS9532443.1 mannan chain length control protein LmeA [Mycolicibacter acidiphilus]